MQPQNLLKEDPYSILLVNSRELMRGSSFLVFLQPGEESRNRGSSGWVGQVTCAACNVHVRILQWLAAVRLVLVQPSHLHHESCWELVSTRSSAAWCIVALQH